MVPVQVLEDQDQHVVELDGDVELQEPKLELDEGNAHVQTSRNSKCL